VPAIFDYECLERAFEKLSALVARLDPWGVFKKDVYK
jgi:hypothetical protein